ncbi:tudor domain-containing protein 6 [Phaenicophaeus curvirostris]|uniref:tudor domain-containing protein 6 n=1 Tax=Phaenicophaeus curvirostris TaxID=33595 RepID=UPI0037F0CCD7
MAAPRASRPLLPRPARSAPSWPRGAPAVSVPALAAPPFLEDALPRRSASEKPRIAARGLRVTFSPTPLFSSLLRSRSSPPRNGRNGLARRGRHVTGGRAGVTCSARGLMVRGGRGGSPGRSAGAAGMPGPGSAVSLRVCAVDLRPEVPVLRLWGLLGERGAEHVRLQREIQAAAGPRLASPASGRPGAELSAGDLVLVELLGLWYRCCVLSRCGQRYRVFLLDEGCTVVTSAHYLAWGRRELFQVPPEALGCIVADALPSRCTRLAACGDALVSAWTVETMEFLSHLHGKEVRGVVRSVLMPQVIVLELPQLVAQLNHLGLAKQVTACWFGEVLRQCQASGHLRNQLRAQPPACSLVTSVPQFLPALLSYQPVFPALDYFYPRLQLGVREPVLVTHVYDPHRIYCQLQSLSQEIDCLSDTMRHVSDLWEQDLLPQVGSPYAACGRDGKWYRALLLELLAGERDQQAALVIFVDYGRKEVVPRANLRHLPIECFRMPVVTYLCALQGVSDGSRGWSPLQIADLKALVLGKTVSACIKAFNSFENLYYVCLYGECGINLNQLFGVQACCLASSLWQVRQTEAPDQPKGAEFTAKEQELQPGAPSVALTHRDLPSAPVVGLRPNLGVFHDVCVSHIQNPSEFWLQLPEHRRLFRQLRQSMWNFYSHAVNLHGAGWQLQPGSVCCASGKEGACYRAVINRVLNGSVEIHLMDKGNTETVDQCVLKKLLPRFRELPSLALKCGLAGVSPLGGSWSETSLSAFREIVLNKELKVHFLSMQGDKYMVEIFDQSQLGEISVSKLLAQRGHAEYQRCEIPEALQKSLAEAEHHTSSPARAGKETQINTEKRSGDKSDLKRFDRVLNPCVAVTVGDSAFEAIHSSKNSKSLPAQKYESKENLPISGDVEMKPTSSYRGQLEVGSTVNVDVSYVENPSHFWCQLSKSCCDLEVLMAEIQEYCINSSHPCTWPSSACLAQYSEDEKWYRALILSEVPSAEKVEVLYVDYGNRDLVSLTNLRSTDERFLRLEAQAFRCSLYNLIQPNGQDPLAWDEEAIQAFQEFIDTSKSHLELKCTVFALASVNNKELFNIVDLMTPFQSACQFLIKRGVARPLSPQKPLVSSIQLHSYYYSMHGIKIGSEEEVFITHVDGPWRFYCQLQRCADVLAQLTNNISCLSETITSLETLQKPGSLCLAKYSDNHWYRAVTMKTTPRIEVFFVDFGNTETIENDHLLPLPSDASDILLLPMQAIKCSLSDISDVSNEAAMWFKQTVLERQLKLIVVAKESDGKLLVELFDDNTQINAKLKEKFSLINSSGLCAHVENQTLCSRNTGWNERNETVESPLKEGFSFLEKTKYSSEAQGGGKSRERHCKDNDVNLFQPATKGDAAAGLLESHEIFSVKKDALSLNKVKESSLLSVQMDTQSDIKSDAEGQCVTLNVPDPLQQKVVPALKALVYVSCIKDPLDFYVQLQSDEEQLNSILESLNNRTPTKNACGQLLQAGDIISALYSEDSLWYRAVVREKTSDNLISVQYIDYGNTSVINVDQAHRLPEDLSSIPAISIHCFLSGLKGKPSADWAEKTVLYFTKRTSEALLMCEFVEKVEDKWEVVLRDHQGIITVDLADENLASGERSCSTESSDMLTASKPLPPQAQNEISSVSACKSFIWKFPEAGQAVKIYVSVVNGPEYFWSFSAEAEDMKYIEEKIEEAENLGLKSLNDCKSCIKSGDICLAKYSQDGRFYRAKVCSIEGGNVFVRHVDYGSEEAVSLEMVRQIPCDLLQVPNQAFPCCLSGFESSEGSWLSEAKDKFYDMTKDLLLEAAVVETWEDKACDVPLCVVKLEASGKSINEEMKPFWKANRGTGDNAFSDLENPLKENRCSNNDMGLCLKTETTGACGLAPGESESALLCSEPFLGETAECLNTVEASVSVGAAEYLSGKTGDRCETAEHQSNFDGETSLLEGGSNDSVSLEPRSRCNLPVLGSERKAAEQELCEVLFGESVKLKAELPGSASAASLFLGNDQEQPRLPVLPGQSSSGDEMGLLVALDQLQIQSSYNNDLKTLMMKLEALSAQSSGEEAKEALETVSLEMQTASGSEAREKTLERELFQLPVVSKETRELAALKCLDILPSRDERENSVPSVISGENTTDLIPSDDLLSLGEKAEQLELNLSGAHKVEAIEEDWMEAKPPSLRLTSSGGGPEKQVNLKTHDMLSVMGAEIEHLLELVQPSQEGREEDLLGLEHTALQSSTNSESQFSFCTENLMNRRPVCTLKSCDCQVEKLQEWQKEKEHCYVDEWMKQDLTGSFKECGNTCVWSSDCKPGDEEVEKKQNEILADCSAKGSEYTCNLKGFAVGSKCMVWTSLKWCEARILEISYKGTRVLNLSSGREEIVDPENVWNGIPDWACQSPRSAEAITTTTEDVQSLTEKSLLQEKQTGCSPDSAEDPCVL